MLTKEFRNSFIEAFSKSKSESEFRMNCDLMGFQCPFDYTTASEYFRITELLDSEISITAYSIQNSYGGDFRLHLEYMSYNPPVPTGLGSQNSIPLYRTYGLSTDTIEIPWVFIDEVLVERIAESVDNHGNSDIDYEHAFEKLKNYFDKLIENCKTLNSNRMIGVV